MRDTQNAESVVEQLPKRTSRTLFGPKKEENQYLAVDVSGRSATWTGSDVFDAHEELSGKFAGRFVYAIAGNILDSKLEVTQKMKAAFEGPGEESLADRLVAALNAADMKGADSRCHKHSTSSLSAYLKVARETDTENALSIDIVVPTSDGKSPVASVSAEYDGLKATGSAATTTASRAPTAQSGTSEDAGVAAPNLIRYVAIGVGSAVLLSLVAACIFLLCGKNKEHEGKATSDDLEAPR